MCYLDGSDIYKYMPYWEIDWFAAQFTARFDTD